LRVSGQMPRHCQSSNPTPEHTHNTLSSHITPHHTHLYNGSRSNCPRSPSLSCSSIPPSLCVVTAGRFWHPLGTAAHLPSGGWCLLRCPKRRHLNRRERRKMARGLTVVSLPFDLGICLTALRGLTMSSSRAGRGGASVGSQVNQGWHSLSGMPASFTHGSHPH